MPTIEKTENETDLSDLLEAICVETSKTTFTDGEVIEQAYIKVDCEGTTEATIAVRWINGTVDVRIHRADAIDEVTIHHRKDQWVKKIRADSEKWTDLKVID